jgi:hypothetical protein
MNEEIKTLTRIYKLSHVSLLLFTGNYMTTTELPSPRYSRSSAYEISKFYQTRNLQRNRNQLSSALPSDPKVVEDKIGLEILKHIRQNLKLKYSFDKQAPVQAERNPLKLM